ncbi:sensor domain-containing protein [Streptomyces sp. HB132]|uniref:sensor histidine kinase n=1 Tax=Streptomyces sp. HB132 TaxID=767388 RepID=UPI00196101E9|nr:sensor domain-containing protein [Streptomyces sp. HB132]MBM7440069.1 signal transduction histidine kinase [Streptomyces sp. HB132]
MTDGTRPCGTSWRRALRLAPVRGVALAALGAAGLLLVVPMAVALLSGAVGTVLRIRRLPALRRRLAASWSRVDIPDPYVPHLSEARAREGGLYRHGRRLYASGSTARRKRGAWKITRDPATARDLWWLLLDPLVGAPVAVLPAALICAGLAGVSSPLWHGGNGSVFAAGLGVASVSAGVAAGPSLILLHGYWTRLLLGAGVPVPGGGTRWWTRLWRQVQTVGAACLLCALAVCGLVLAGLQLVAAVFSLVLGLVPVFTQVVLVSRKLVNLWRELLRHGGLADITEPYRQQPSVPVQGADGHYVYGRTLHPGPLLPTWLAARRWVLTDPATWRDLLWLLTNPVVAAVLLLGPTASVLAVGLWWSGPAGFAAALVAAGVALWGTPYTLRAQARWCALLLAPTDRSVLTRRVQQLTTTRAEATGVQAAELLRIERDLHDGAQTRLVAIGMSLRAIERRLGSEQPELRAMAAEARENSSAALRELRSLVRGVHPPVLAERGLVDAVRTLALAHPLTVEVTADLQGRAQMPVAACAYFSVSEALTNTAKHSGAQRVVIDLRHRAGALRITVTDDGCGGADPARGSGIRGIQRRLATFDGLLDVASPPGGPTTLTMELPCVLSSARTSTSSGKD